MMRCLIENKRFLSFWQAREYFLAFFSRLRQKPNERKNCRIKARTNQCGQCCICPRQRRYTYPRLNRKLCKVAARISDSRQSGITNTNKIFSTQKIFNKLRPFRKLVMFMITRKPGMYIEMRQKVTCMTRIFCRNKFDLSKYTYRSIGHILKIADWRR